MKTRISSVIERGVIYTLIFVCLAVDVAVYLKLSGDYKTRLRIAEEKSAEMKKQIQQLRRSYSNKMAEREQLNREYIAKQRKDAARLEEYEQQLSKLNEYMKYLPPYDIAHELLKQINLRAIDQNIKLTNITMLEDPEQETKAEQNYSEYQFDIEVEGDYGNLLQFLWTLENAIFLKKYDDQVKPWKAIIKYRDGGLIIQNLNTENDTMKLRLGLVTFFYRPSES